MVKLVLVGLSIDLLRSEDGWMTRVLREGQYRGLLQRHDWLAGYFGYCGTFSMMMTMMKQACSIRRLRKSLRITSTAPQVTM